MLVMAPRWRPTCSREEGDFCGGAAGLWGQGHWGAPPSATGLTHLCPHCSWPTVLGGCSGLLSARLTCSPGVTGTGCCRRDRVWRDFWGTLGQRWLNEVQLRASAPGARPPVPAHLPPPASSRRTEVRSQASEWPCVGGAGAWRARVVSCIFCDGRGPWPLRQPSGPRVCSEPPLPAAECRASQDAECPLGLGTRRAGLAGPRGRWPEAMGAPRGPRKSLKTAGSLGRAVASGLRRALGPAHQCPFPAAQMCQGTFGGARWSVGRVLLPAMPWALSSSVLQSTRVP